MVTDTALIEQARAGGIALDRLITAVWSEAYRIAFSVLRDRGLAEDATQEACAKIAASLGQLNDPSGFASWSYRLIVRQAIDVGRRMRPARPLEEVTQPAVEFDAIGSIDLQEALGKLPLVQRAAVILHYYAGFNSGEIAQATGLPASTVRFHLMHARRTLRKALSSDPPPAVAREEAVRHVH